MHAARKLLCHFCAVQPYHAAGSPPGLLQMQVKADAYEKLDKELLGFIEDVLLNRCDNATERMLEYAALLDPKSKPTAVRKKAEEKPPEVHITPRVNPVDGMARIAAPDPMPPVPSYKFWSDPIKKSDQFELVSPTSVQTWIAHSLLLMRCIKTIPCSTCPCIRYSITLKRIL